MSKLCYAYTMNTLSKTVTKDTIDFREVGFLRLDIDTILPMVNRCIYITVDENFTYENFYDEIHDYFCDQIEERKEEIRELQRGINLIYEIIEGNKK